VRFPDLSRLSDRCDDYLLCWEEIIRSLLDFLSFTDYVLPYLFLFPLDMALLPKRGTFPSASTFFCDLENERFCCFVF